MAIAGQVRRVLAGREAALGPKHEDTLASASNLAAILGKQGKVEEAEKLKRMALAGEEVLRPLVTAIGPNRIAIGPASVSGWPPHGLPMASP